MTCLKKYIVRLCWCEKGHPLSSSRTDSYLTALCHADILRSYNQQRVYALNNYIILGGFILLIIGTLGLLLNEFVFDWGRAATLTFAVFNICGLVSLVVTHFIKLQNQ